MNKPANPMSQPMPWDLVATGYAENVEKYFGPFARRALELVELAPDSRVLDVACGPGTLSRLAAKTAASVSAIDFSKGMIDILNQTLAQEGITNIDTTCGDGQDLPYADASFDAAFSLFGLMFFPDRMKGYAGIHRILKPGGRILVSSWAPLADSPAMWTMFGAIRAMKPELPEPKTVIDSLENPEFFKNELEAAGFVDVAIHRVTNSLEIDSIDLLWDELVKGSAPIAMMKANLDEDEWREKEQAALRYLHEALPELPVTLGTSAWFGMGTR